MKNKTQLLCAVGAVLASTLVNPAMAQTSSAEQRIARLEAELRKLRSEVARQAPVTKGPVQQATYSPPVRAPYNWSGVYAGVFMGGAYQVSKSHATYGALPETGVGFGSASGGLVPVSSTWYGDYATGGPSSTKPYVKAYADCRENGIGSDCDFDYGTNGPHVTSTRTDSTATTDLSRRSLVGALGLQAGANYQTGRVVLGVAGDFSWLSAQSNATYGSTGAFNYASTRTGWSESSSNDTNTSFKDNGEITQSNNGSSSYSGMVKITPQWLSTMRLTAGIADERFMTFVSGGLAFGSVNARISSRYSDTMSSTCDGHGGYSAASSGSFAYNNNGVGVSCGSAITSGNGSQTAHADQSHMTSASWNHSSNKIRTGFALGGGFAYALTDNAILKVESYYYSLGKMTTTVNGTGTTTSYNTTTAPSTSSTNVASYKVQTDLSGVLGRVGIDFKY